MIRIWQDYTEQTTLYLQLFYFPLPPVAYEDNQSLQMLHTSSKDKCDMFLKRCHTWKELDLDWQKVGTRRGLIHFITNFWSMTQGVTDVLFYLKIVVFSKNMSNETVKHKICIRKAWFFQPIKIHSFAVTLPTLAQWHFVSTDYRSPYALWQASITSWNHTVGNQMCIITVFRFTFFSSPHTILHLVFFISGNFVLALFSEPAKQNKQHFNSFCINDISLNHLLLFCFHFNPRCQIKFMNLTSLNTDKSVLYLGL